MAVRFAKLVGMSPLNPLFDRSLHIELDKTTYYVLNKQIIVFRYAVVYMHPYSEITLRDDVSLLQSKPSHE